MVALPVGPADESDRSACWCCGTADDPARMIHLGNHPEVALCVRCGYWAGQRSREIDDRARSGPLVRGRNGLRALRRGVIRHGWQHHRLLGRPLRWLGRHLP